MLLLCDRVDDVTFAEEQGQDQFAEFEQEQLHEEGKWTSSPAYSF